MLDDYHDRLFHFVDARVSTEACWSIGQFSPDHADSVPHVLLAFLAASYCHAAFVNGGLAAMLESFVGDMTPEFIAFLRYLECADSAERLDSITTQFFAEPFPRQSEARCAIVERNMAVLDGDLSDLFDNLLVTEEFDDKVNSFSRHHCLAWDLTSDEGIGGDRFQALWQRPFAFDE